MLRKHWAFALVLALQLGLLAAVPARKLLAKYGGTEISLMTRPVDPFDLLAGYYVTLAYAVEVDAARLAPRGVTAGDPVWLELTAGEPAWSLVAVHRARPEPLDGRVAIRGVWRGREADLPEASRLYISEIDRAAVDRALDHARGRGLVDIRVAADGTPVVLRLRVGGETFGD